MKQDKLTSIPDLRGAAAIAKAAAVVKGPGVPLLQNTAINIGADADTLTTACNTHEAGKVVLATYRSVLATIVIMVRAFLTLGRDLMKPVLGGEYSQAFDVLGLIGSLMIPSKTQDLLVILAAFKAFFTDHPELEDASRNITAAQCQVLYDQLLAAQNTVNVQVAEVQTSKETRDVAADKLRKRLRGLVEEMGQFLDPLDSRWLAFGLKKPGAQETPDVVEGLIAVLIGPGTSALKWKAPARAEYYRVYKRVIGVDAEPVAVGSPADLDFTLENLPANSTVEVYVSAVNNGGESALSEKVTLVTH
ncbi:MAG: hypothetical protein JWM68_5729 [Verrucomicrobiales bacterium]|nr:hypothetical protein [Verrucomicrobiales bacterium]